MSAISKIPGEESMEEKQAKFHKVVGYALKSTLTDVEDHCGIKYEEAISEEASMRREMVKEKRNAEEGAKLTREAEQYQHIYKLRRVKLPTRADIIPRETYKFPTKKDETLDCPFSKNLICKSTTDCICRQAQSEAAQRF
ncbi:hypothetical protein LXL04_020381 [Taraxacum kok-saghyz]